MFSIEFGGASPQVHADAWVALNATLIGDVILHAEASVFYSSVLRGDLGGIAIGRRSNIQDGCIVHADPGRSVTIGRDVSIGHSAVLHGCSIEDQCLIGMGAVVLNGARIGRGSLVAAGAVVAEDTEIPPGSLVAGVPAKIRRTLQQEQIDALRQNADTYVDLSQKHRASTASTSG